MTSDDSVHVLTKTEAAYRALRRDILSTRLEPGAPLRVKALEETYGVGWTPLREALSRLEAENLVTSSPNRGFAVAAVSREELEDLISARRLIEPPLVLDSLRHGGRDWEDRVILAHHRLAAAPCPSETLDIEHLDAWELRHQEFHLALASGGRPGWLWRFLEQLSGHLRRSHRRLSTGPLLRRETESGPMAALRRAMSIEGHTPLMEAALARDAARMAALLEEHMNHTLEVYATSGEGSGGA